MVFVSPEEDCVCGARVALAEKRPIPVPGGSLPGSTFLICVGVAACNAGASAEMFLDKPRMRTLGKDEGASNQHQNDYSNFHFDLQNRV